MFAFWNIGTGNNRAPTKIFSTGMYKKFFHTATLKYQKIICYT